MTGNASLRGSPSADGAVLVEGACSLRILIVHGSGLLPGDAEAGKVLAGNSKLNVVLGEKGLAERVVNLL